MPPLVLAFSLEKVKQGIMLNAVNYEYEYDEYEPSKNYHISFKIILEGPNNLGNEIMIPMLVMARKSELYNLRCHRKSQCM